MMQNNKSTSRTFIFLLLLSLIHCSLALDYYVTMGGNDDNDCTTEATACSSVQGAMQKDSLPKTIFVGAGTFTGGFNFAFGNATIIGQGSGRTELNVEGQYVITNAAYAELRGVTFTGASGAVAFEIQTTVYVNIFQDVIFRNMTVGALWKITGTLAVSFIDCEIRDNTFSSGSAIELAANGALRSSIRIVRSHFRNNVISTGSVLHVVCGSAPTYITMVFSTVMGNRAASASGFLEISNHIVTSGACAFTAQDSIFEGNSGNSAGAFSLQTVASGAWNVTLNQCVVCGNSATNGADMASISGGTAAKFVMNGGYRQPDGTSGGTINSFLFENVNDCSTRPATTTGTTGTTAGLETTGATTTGVSTSGDVTTSTTTDVASTTTATTTTGNVFVTSSSSIIPNPTTGTPLTPVAEESSDKTLIIVGAVVGSLGAVLLIAAGIAFLIWKRKRTEDNEEEQSDEEAVQLNVQPTPQSPKRVKQSQSKNSTHSSSSSDEESKQPTTPEQASTKMDSLKLNTIPWEDVTIGKMLGKGNFGEVFKGDWNGTPVALKKLINTDGYEQFASEAKLLGTLNHPNVVRMLGMMKDGVNGDWYIVTEFVPMGSLSDLLEKKGQDITVFDLLNMSCQVAAGMRYLEQKKVIHRDLAVRNILVTKEVDKYVVKLSDFGLGKANDNYVSPDKDTKLPIRWCSPEVLLKRQFSSKSDVYAFGITVWEMFEYGTLPYYQYNNTEVVSRIVDGQLLGKPEHCPKEVYELLKQCWQKSPSDRPSFKHIYDTLREISEKMGGAVEDSQNVSSHVPDSTLSYSQFNSGQDDEGNYAKTPNVPEK